VGGDRLGLAHARNRGYQQRCDEGGSM